MITTLYIIMYLTTINDNQSTVNVTYHNFINENEAKVMSQIMSGNYANNDYVLRMSTMRN